MGRSNREYNPNKKAGGRGKWIPDAGGDGGGGRNSSGGVGGKKQPSFKKGTVSKKKRPAKFQVFVNKDGSIQQAHHNNTKQSRIRSTSASKTKQSNKSSIGKSPRISEFLERIQKRDKKRKRREKEQQQQQEAPLKNALQLPSKHAGKQARNIPWMVTAISNATTPGTIDLTTPSPKNSRKKKKAIRLPTDDVDPEWLEHLSDELIAFSEYVRLSPTEQSARSALVEELTQLAQTMQPRHQRFSPLIPPSVVSFQPFGSFAAPSVCTYHSDVDLALWGVVEGVQRPPQQQRAAAQKEESSLPTQQPPTASSPSSKKQQRRKDPKEALAALDEENLYSPGDIPFHKSIGHNKESPNEEKGDTEKDTTSHSDDDGIAGGDMPLFVLDREGNVGEEAKVNAAAEAETENDDVIEINSTDSSSDDDSADKLEGLIDRKTSAEEDGDRRLSAKHAAKAKPTEEDPEHFVSLESSDDSSSSDDENDQDLDADFANEEEDFAGVFPSPDDDDEEVNMQAYMKHMEVGFVNQNDGRNQTASTDVIRKEALGALSQLDRRLRKSRLATSVTFIKRARVPIIKFMTKLGVEVDVSVGGLNGADTSLYAARQSSRYISFAPVVLVLKIMMNQQDLDTPFTGGLGSFKLYVLVAHHIQQHINLGGSDRPGEILLSFLFRYGGESTGDHCVHQQAKTHLSRESEISCLDGSNADLSNVFKIDECTHLFGSGWKRLWSRVRKAGGSAAAAQQQPHRTSLIAELIHVDRLIKERHDSSLKADKFMTPSPNAAGSPENPYAAPPPLSPDAATPPSKGKNSPWSLQWPTDRNAAQLCAGYGARSHRGNDSNKHPFKRARSC